MNKYSVSLLGFVIIMIILGFATPFVIIHYMCFHGLSLWVGVPIVILSIIVTGLIGIVGWGILHEIAEETPSYSINERILLERINVYRARQRAILEELDEISNTLKDILKILKEGGKIE